MSTFEFVAADPKFAEIFYEYRQDAVTKKHNPLMPSTIEELRRRLSKTSSDFSAYKTAEELLWFVKFNGNIAGNISLQKINQTMLTAEIGYGVFAAARRQGVATESVRWLTTEVFSRTPLRKLIAFVHEENLASRRVLEKLGYRNEGILREHYLVNGKPANEVIYGILR